MLIHRGLKLFLYAEILWRCLRAVLIHRGLKLKASYLEVLGRLRAVLIHRGLKQMLDKSSHKKV